MMWQHLFEEKDGDEGPATAREAVKSFLHEYVLLEWTPENIVTTITRASFSGWHLQIGGEIQDNQGEPYTLKRDQLAVRQGANTRWVVFDVAKMMTEVRKDIAREPGQVLTRKCLYCGAALVAKVGTGRNRHYCRDKCRVAHHRRRKSIEHRAAILQEHSELHNYWQEHHIDGELLATLQDILVEYGKGAALAASDAVLFAKQEGAKKRHRYR